METYPGENAAETGDVSWDSLPRKEREFLLSSIEEGEAEIFAENGNVYREPLALKEQELIRSEFERGVAEVVAETGNVFWGVLPLQDGRWVAWNTSRLSPPVLLYPSRQRALEFLAVGMETLAIYIEELYHDPEWAAEIRSLAQIVLTV